MLRQGWILALSLLAVSAYAADNGAKTYTLKDLKTAVSNHRHCKALSQDLQNLAKNPIVLQFTKQDQGVFTVQDQDNKITRHHLMIVKQNAMGNIMNRVVMGSLEINHKKVDYVVEVAADLTNKNHQYIYPTIISGENSHCFFTALLVPDKKTVAAFKKNVQSGNISDGKDLYTN
ncbi:MAG: hypothetical protein ACD_60C00013G0006 [uncultured bacterium]|nr:MAG: hypothetical protein ACD_60C00013G0006 [uncultured bacterium]